jgi:hypothetical protein
MHNTWIAATAVALAATGLTCTPALASYYCGAWGNDEVRCIGNNGLSSGQPGGLSARDYTMSVAPAVAGKEDYGFSVDVWRSLCRFPGTITKQTVIKSRSSTPRTFALTEHVEQNYCVEFFITRCTDSPGRPRSCQDFVGATIREGGQ